ncbi:flavin reductase family protein [Arthrobacter sp. AZCC_0090]|uniref:flavin reductase family protein n=1 Tax=Arthrobacter sp. AZCC_0090 TaxID=2735881 RepID=UPI00160C64AF|nr:flavin reductase family protein [Arthrobacter sp. AZCC_0090]MBB6407088.1 flavin reductase (DIM6/NTAB) family NADH-FMN oxidoreductase RutF [Arthrobacter sp. AZCC_0090]
MSVNAVRNGDAAPAVGEHPRRIAGGLTPDEFKGAFRNHPAGVAVVTADAGAGPVGLTATSVFSVSTEPPLLVFSVSELSSSRPTILMADTLVVHLVGSTQLHLAQLCATSGIDRFADTTLWGRLDSGEPYFPSASVWIRGRVVDRLDAGTSTLIVVHALETQAPVAGSDAASAAESQPLVYHNRAWHALGENSLIPPTEGH